MAGWRLGVALLVFLLTVQSESKNVVFCKPERNEQFIDQSGKCKKCDRCPKGWGFDTREEVAMDPVHGALTCKGCVSCIPGVTFNKFINYGPCRLCNNCTASGLRHIRPCTVERNAKCGKPLPPPPTKQLMQSEISNSAEKAGEKLHQSTANEDLTSFRVVFTLTILSVGLLMSLFIIVVFVCRKNSIPSQPRRNGVEETHQNVSRSEENDSTMPMETRQTSNAYKNTIVDEMCQESFLFLNQTSHVEEDGNHLHRVSDGGFEGDEEIPSDALLQGLCSELAANNGYRKAARLLGVSDYDIEIIREETRGDTKESAFQTLRKWRELKGKEATKQQLREALRSTGRQDLADKIQGLSGWKDNWFNPFDQVT